jgi:hypothetical protein
VLNDGTSSNVGSRSASSLYCTLVYIAYFGIELISIVIPVCCGLPLAIESFSLVTIIAEEHLSTFYSYEDNINIENEDVWMRVFVQSFDGTSRKWFRDLNHGSIARIEALDGSFLRH